MQAGEYVMSAQLLHAVTSDTTTDARDAAARQRIHQLLDGILDADLTYLCQRIVSTEQPGSLSFSVTLKFDSHGNLLAKAKGKASLPPIVTDLDGEITRDGALTLF